MWETTLPLLIHALLLHAAPTRPLSDTDDVGHPAAQPRSVNRVKYAGVNIAGFDFGSGDSTCGVVNSSAYPPLISNGVVSYGGPDGVGQMECVQHLKLDTQPD